MKTLLSFLSILFLVSCNHDNKKDVEREMVEDVIVPTTESRPIKESVTDSTSSNVTSYLSAYKSKLEASKYKYVISNHNGLLSPPGFYDVDETYSKGIENIERALKDVGKTVVKKNSFQYKAQVKRNGDVFPQGTMIEYIFKNDSIATASYTRLMELKSGSEAVWKDGIDWNSPALMVRKENRIYHIITGGDHMAGTENEIADIIF
ncbi:hypothetical protein [Nonlabens sp. Asnod3-A02]|uniref:hypothetical protein n=1 Tax=Nonlabens sp. Asnod3-A02 TaxID=3160579 RepID=UPI00386FBAE7